MSADIQNRILAHKICDNTLAFAKEGDAVRGHRSDPPRAGVRAFVARPASGGEVAVFGVVKISCKISPREASSK